MYLVVTTHSLLLCFLTIKTVPSLSTLCPIPLNNTLDPLLFTRCDYNDEIKLRRTPIIQQQSRLFDKHLHTALTRLLSDPVGFTPHHRVNNLIQPLHSPLCKGFPGQKRSVEGSV